MDFVDAYRTRLHIGSDDSLPPTTKSLRLLTERHLQYIPFSSISWHSPCEDDGRKVVVLTKEELLRKLLVHNQGGCCLELNGAFAILLHELGYSLRFIKCWVYAGKERGHSSKKSKFRVQQTHFVLLVKALDSKHSWLVDVGLGEPPCQPLKYEVDLVQETPEQMKSRIIWDPRGPWVDGQGRTRKCLLLEWFHDGGWEPRLQWDVTDAPLVTEGPWAERVDLEPFETIIPILSHPKSTFSSKLVVSCLKRHEKVTLTGRVLKRTSPRFGDCQIETENLVTENDVKHVLAKEFGIVQPFCLAKSDLSKNRKLWTHL